MTHSLYKAESGLALTVTDNHSFMGIGARSGTGGTTITVSHAIASKYVLTAASTTPQSGVAFDVTTNVRDQYDNQASSWVSDTLTYSWILGASSSVSNPKTAGVLNASVLGSGVRTFSGGTYTTTGTGFNLYRSSETSRLRVQIGRAHV